MTKSNSRFPLYRILIIGYISLLILMLMLGVILYNQSYRNVETGIREQNQLLLEGSISRIDTAVEIINATARQITSNQSFLHFTEALSTEREDFYYAGYQLQRQLSDTTPLTHLLPVVANYIYLSPIDYVISPTDFQDYDFYYRHNASQAQGAAVMKAMFTENTYWHRFIQLPGLGTATGSYLYIFPLSTRIPAQVHADYVLCYEFDGDEIGAYFADLGLNENGMLVAYTKNGRIGLQYTEGDLALNPSVLPNLSFEDGSADYVDPNTGATMLVTTTGSSYNNWTYYLVQPKDKMFYSINLYRSYYFGITMFTFLIGGVTAALYMLFSRKRVAQLSTELSVQEEATDALHQEIEKQLPAVQESMLRRIMEGSITTNEEMLQISSSLMLEREDTQFLVLYTEIGSSMGLEVTPADLPLLMQNYDILVRDALQRYFPDTGYIYRPSDLVFATLCAFPASSDYPTMLKQLEERFHAMHEDLMNHYHIFLTGGFGDATGLVSHLWQSFQHAKETQALTTEGSYLLSFYDLEHSKDTYYYPESLEVQLTGFINAGNEAQVREVFALLIQENMDKRRLRYSELRWLISDIRATLLKKRQRFQEETLSEGERAQLDLIDRHFEEELSLNTLQSLAIELSRLSSGDSQSSDLILRIQEYINQNYHDPDLGLTKISERFGISENYFSYLFKKELSQNFSAYLESLRMAKAKELVAESTLPLSGIYQHLGYNNAASFRRAFKKNFGVSPKEMRESVHKA